MLVETPLDETVATITPASPPAAAARTRSKKEDVPVLGKAGQNFARNWTTTLFMLAFHIGAVAALFFFTWKGLIAAVVLYVLAINVGIGMCYHRLLTHRGYKVPKWLEYAMTACAPLSLEGGPIFWVATHRVHHQLSDHEGDPHTPHDGGWWAHVDWILKGDALHHETALLSRYAPDLAKDPVHRMLSRYHWVPLVVVGLALLAIGGWPLVLGGSFLGGTVWLC